jgi:hypothetical protein
VNFTQRFRGHANNDSPQTFVAHPSVNGSTSINPDDIGIQAAAPFVPGRYPIAAWDGEANAQAPTITKAL